MPCNICLADTHDIHRLVDGERFEVTLNPPEAFNYTCCDCGLVHRVCFAVEENGNLGVATMRLAEETRSQRSNIDAYYLLSVLKSYIEEGVLKEILAVFPEAWFDVTEWEDAVEKGDGFN